MTNSFTSAKRQALTEELSVIESRRKVIQKNLSDLDTVDRLMAQVEGDIAPTPTPSTTSYASKSVKNKASSAAKPVKDMAGLILGVMKTEGHAGLTSKQMAEIIGPTVSHRQVTPTAWKLSQDGKLVKNADVYHLPLLS